MGKRVVLEAVLSPEQCHELLLLARALAVLGYRDHVCSCTIFEVAAALPQALIPLVAARQAVHAAVEEALDVPLLVEFTGLICWRPGAAIGFHGDANRPYLRQRTHSAVCYLQRAGADFSGGTFQFAFASSSGGGSGSGGGDCRGSAGGSGSRGGGPVDVLAAPGRVVAYDAHEEHGVTPVTGGERAALTLWFTDRPDHCEDARLLDFLAGAPLRPLGLPATMWRLPDGTDLRLCRLAMAGLVLVHGGCLLHSAEELDEGQGGDASGGGSGNDTGSSQELQLAVQPAVLQAWVAWHEQQQQQQQAASTGSQAQEVPPEAQSKAALQPQAAAAYLVPGVRFSAVQEAVLSAQRWCWQRCPAGWSRERVCCAHLCQPLADAEQQQPLPSCSWLRSCQLSGSERSAELAGLGIEVAAAAADSAGRLQEHGRALQAVRPRWKELGALFVEG